jgi:RND family efflux transporter MFP subunit
MPRLEVIIAVLVFGSAVAGCKQQKAKTAEIRPVRTTVVDPKPIDDDRQAVGEIKARYESDLGFRVAGKVIERMADIGVSVKEGAVLARLDKSDFQNKLRGAEADASSAEAILAETKGAEDRQGQLLAKGVTTRVNYDAALKNLRTAEAQLASAQAALALAKDQLNYSELKAEFAGIVTATGAEAGQVVGVGQMVVRVAKPAVKDAVFNIAESAFRERKPDDRPAITVNLLSDPSVQAEGVVREISPVADPTTRTYQVKVTLPDAPDAMRFGSSVVGRLETMTAPVVVLPGSALFDKQGHPAVWIFDSASSQVRLKQIVVARFESNGVVVSDGLSKGDIVVTAGVNRLHEGQTVKLLEGAPQ